MSYIITGGLGGKSLVMQGYGGKWKKVVLPKREPHYLCPNCHEFLKKHIYVTRDVLTGEKIYRCGNCYAILMFEDGKWVEVGYPYHDDW